MSRSARLKSLRWTLLSIATILFFFCLLPGFGEPGSMFNADAKAYTATATVPELPIIAMPLLLAIVGRAGMKARRKHISE